MGELRVSVGPVVGSLAFDDAKGADIINDYIIVYGGPVEGTNAEKLQWFVADLARHVQDAHRGYRRREAERVAREQAETDVIEWQAETP